MFLSPILILALLFSSCDDGEKAPDNTVTLKVTSGDIALTPDSTAIAKSESFTVTAAPKEIPEATEVSIKVTLSGENYTVEGSFSVPKGKEPTDKTELKWDSLEGVSTTTKTVSALTLTGKYDNGTFTVESGSYSATDIPKGTVTIPYDKIGQDLKTAASDASATVNWGTTDSEFNGNGTWDDPTSGDIKLNDVPTNTESIYVKVVLTGGDNGTYKSDEISITFEETEATVDSEVSFTKEEPVTLTLSGSPASITGNNIQDNDVITITTNPTTGLENATSTNVTIKKTSGSWTVSGEIKLPAGETFTSESLSWTGLEVTASTSSAKVTAVTLSGKAGGSDSQYTFTVTGGTITAEAGDGA